MPSSAVPPPPGLAASEHVLLRIDDGVATITLNRPERRNALSLAANERLRALWDDIDDDASVRAVILTSVDCGTFCAGMDLKEAAQMRAQTGRDILDLLADPFYERMRSVSVPIVAAMTGHFTAAGMVLAANCDLRVGLAGSRGGITEGLRGRGTPWAAPMIDMLPQAALMEMIVTSRLLPIERLHQIGFVNYVESTPGAVRARALELAQAVKACAPLSVKVGKAGVLAAAAAGAEGGLALSKRLHRQVYRSEDAQEGPRAFAEGRDPVWQGR